jgi:uncharacterized protein YkwD
MRAEPLFAVALASAAFALSAPAAGAQAPSAGTGNCPDADLNPTPENLPRVETAILCVLNVQRSAAGMVLFRREGHLDASALFHSIDMARYHFFAHRGPGRPALLDRVMGAGYFSGATAGLYAENLGEGPMEAASAQKVAAAWEQSGEHQANILDPRLDDIGIGAVLVGSDPAFYPGYNAALYVTDFGWRQGGSSSGSRSSGHDPSATTPAERRRCRAHSRRRGKRHHRQFCQARPTAPAPARPDPAPGGNPNG